MSVIAHWIAYDLTRPSHPHIVVRSIRARDGWRGQGYTIEGPFVHADQLTGAVEALERIRDGYPGGSMDVAVVEAWYQEQARAIVGGQSE